MPPYPRTASKLQANDKFYRFLVLGTTLGFRIYAINYDFFLLHKEGKLISNSITSYTDIGSVGKIELFFKPALILLLGSKKVDGE